MVKFTKEKNQETILAIILGLLAVWYFTGIKILVVISLVLATVGLLWQRAAGWITYFWMKLSHVMGWVMSKVILSLVFFLVLFPVSMLSRLFKKDLLQLKKSDNKSYYTERNHTYIAEDLENPW